VRIGAEQDLVVGQPGRDEHALGAGLGSVSGWKPNGAGSMNRALSQWCPAPPGLAVALMRLVGTGLAERSRERRYRYAYGRRELPQLVEADPRELRALVAGNVLIALDISQPERGAIGPDPPVPRGLPRAARGRVELQAAGDDLLQFAVGAAEDRALPGVAVARHVLQVVAKQEVRLAAAGAAAEQQLLAPRRGDGFGLRAGLRRPAGLRRRVHLCPFRPQTLLADAIIPPL
jgi:hypothetical protein